MNHPEKNIEQLDRLAIFDDKKDLVITTNPAYGQKDIAVSIIITLYNYEQLIRRCILSAAQQDMEALEIIVVDDRSTDDSVGVAGSLIESLEVPAMLIRKSLNTGVAHSRNIGILKARGRFVFTLDADNYLATSCIRKLYHGLRTKKAAAGYCTIQQIDDQGASLGQVSNRAYKLRKLLNGTFYIDAMAMFDRLVLLDLGMYSTELLRHGIGWEDYELWLRLGLAGHKVIHLNEVLAFYHVHEHSMLSETRLYYDSLKRFLNERYGAKIV